MITSANDDKAAFGFSVAAAVAIFEVISKDLPGFFNTLVAVFFTSFSRYLSQTFGKTI